MFATKNDKWLLAQQLYVSAAIAKQLCIYRDSNSPELQFFSLLSLAREVDGSQFQSKLMRAAFPRRPLFLWLVNIFLTPLDTNSIKAESAWCLLTVVWQGSWHVLFGCFEGVNLKPTPSWSAHDFPVLTPWAPCSSFGVLPCPFSCPKSLLLTP